MTSINGAICMHKFYWENKFLEWVGRFPPWAQTVGFFAVLTWVTLIFSLTHLLDNQYNNYSSYQTAN